MLLKNFVVFEGIDGAGTSTQIDVLKNRAEAGSFFFTAEPTNGPTGKFLRQMLSGDVKLDPRTAAYLFAADRSEHLWGTSAENGGIENQCKNGKIVVSDRYFFSSLAYQCVDCGEELPRVLNKIFPLPEILFFFAINPEISLSRITGRGTREIYEKLDFLKATEDRYKKIVEKYKNPQKNEGMKIVEIDASLPKEKVSEIIWEELKNLPILM